jgi:hypothetical protein
MNDRPPLIENAQGLAWRKRKHGWEARWRARADLILRGYRPKNVRLWLASKDDPEPSANAIAFIQDRCVVLQRDMLLWAHGGLPDVAVYDGRLASLVNQYKSDKVSTYHSARFVSRKYYDVLCRRLSDSFGDHMIREIRARDIKRWHMELCVNEDDPSKPKIAMASSVIGMLRTVVGYGATMLEDEDHQDDCARLSAVLHKLRFPMAPPRVERLTAEHVVAIRNLAHQRGQHSIALAQAFQFEVMLRQKDVIGEWVPISEPGVSAVTYGNNKWIRGLRWEEIDDNLILRHTTSKRLKDIEVDLKNAPMVMEELSRLSSRPASGPIVVAEHNGLPYFQGMFRHKWRPLADAAGIPKSVRNMDSRAGAISEATDAGADLEHVRHAATHSDISMTQRYSRNSVEKVANVQHKRASHRNKSGT